MKKAGEEERSVKMLGKNKVERRTRWEENIGQGGEEEESCKIRRRVL